MGYQEDGESVVEELDKVVLTKGVWSTILFRYRERKSSTGEFGPVKASLRRYQKHQGVYKKRDAVNLTADSAKLLISSLNEWLENGSLK